jgi:electron transfer flavoprotein alpha subunit
MAGILIWAETKNGEIRKSTLEIITAAQQISNGSISISAALIGDASAAETLSAYPLNTVYVIDDSVYQSYQSESFTDALCQIADQSGADVIIASATAMGRDLTGRVAARLNAALATDVIAIDTAEGLTVDRPVYSGKLIAKMELLAGRNVISIRPNLFAPAEKNDSNTEIVTLSSDMSEVRAIVKDAVSAAQGVLDITEADIIVAGGRGVGGQEGFRLIEETAKLLNGAVGASRTAVDEGWIAYSHQVGQTGKVVSPVLYIACGISGAIQHFAGMGSAKFIIAINTDPEAPIMKKADFAIVGDLFDVLPALRAELSKMLEK